MRRTYSPEQTAYIDAKAAYDSACTVHTNLLEARNFSALLDTGDIERLVQLEMEVEQVSKHEIALATYLAAEKALFAWGKTHALRAARARKQPHETRLVQELFANIHNYYHLKDKLVTICLALDLSK